MSDPENTNFSGTTVAELRYLLSAHARILRKAEGQPSGEAALIGNKLLDSVPLLLDEVERLRSALKNTMAACACDTLQPKPLHPCAPCEVARAALEKEQG